MRWGTRRKYFILAVFLALVHCGAASASQFVRYEFSGHLEVGGANPAADPRHNLPFTATLSYSVTNDDYSADWQPFERFGQFQTLVEGTSLKLNFADIDFVSRGSDFYSTVFIRNDSELSYNQGLPRFTGDQFAFQHYAEQTTVYPAAPQVFGGPINVDEPWIVTTPFLLTFYATDTSGTVFADDRLQTSIDLSRFDDLRIAIREIYPISPVVGEFGTSAQYFPTPVDAIIEDYRLVPEPGSLVLAGIALAILLSTRTIRRAAAYTPLGRAKLREQIACPTNPTRRPAARPSPFRSPCC